MRECCLCLYSSISVHLPSDTQQPEEKEDGNEQEEGVLPIVIAVVEVTVALRFTCILVCWGGKGGVRADCIRYRCHEIKYSCFNVFAMENYGI